MNRVSVASGMHTRVNSTVNISSPRSHLKGAMRSLSSSGPPMRHYDLQIQKGSAPAGTGGTCACSNATVQQPCKSHMTAVRGSREERRSCPSLFPQTQTVSLPFLSSHTMHKKQRCRAAPRCTRTEPSNGARLRESPITLTTE